LVPILFPSAGEIASVQLDDRVGGFLGQALPDQKLTRPMDNILAASSLLFFLDRAVAGWHWEGIIPRGIPVFASGRNYRKQER
jgi:hypothetical protein